MEKFIMFRVVDGFVQRLDRDIDIFEPAVTFDVTAMLEIVIKYVLLTGFKLPVQSALICVRSFICWKQFVGKFERSI